MDSNIYLDESGDLGWNFSKPYRRGGSSRYFTISYFICSFSQRNIPKRLVRDVYRQFGFSPGCEVKASELSPHHKVFICSKVAGMLTSNPGFYLGAITVRKECVRECIRHDSSLLYNYMIGASAMEQVKGHVTSRLTRDDRCVKAGSVRSCIDYLQTLMWLHENEAVRLMDNPCESHRHDGIVFIDWIANIIWSKYEDHTEWCDILSNNIAEKRLFF